MTPISTVAVTGATGFVGRAVVKELLDRGYAVRALVRSEDKAQAVLPMAGTRLSILPGDLTDAASLGRWAQGAQAIVHLIGIIREVREPGRPAQTFQSVHVDGTKAVLRAAKDAGIDRFVHMSAVGVAPDGPAEYVRTKYDAEQYVRRSGLDWTVFRPGVIHGPDGELVAQIRELASGDVPPYFVLPYFIRLVDHEEGVLLPRISLEAAKVAPVFVQDVATVFAEALARPQTIGEVYNVTGPEVLDWQSFMETMRDELPGTDKGLPTIPVPGSHAGIAAMIAKKIGLGALLPFDEGQARMAQLDSDADLSKLRAHFGIEPRPFRESLRAYAPTLPAMA
ncbi:MAG: NAD(P)H-binding protein [Phycisphaerales bacterium]|jgi:NADH dehydrogenase|nr:NAD(P)H-binding protein [Phycisphaerales bacterium]